MKTCYLICKPQLQKLTSHDPPFSELFPVYDPVKLLEHSENVPSFLSSENAGESFEKENAGEETFSELCCLGTYLAAEGRVRAWIGTEMST